MPTLCDLALIDQPETCDGTTLAPLLMAGEKIGRSVPLFWHFPYYHPKMGYQGTTPCAAIRSQDWKLIHFFEDQRSELYQLELDTAESNDLARQESKTSSHLECQLFSELRQRDARWPQRNTDYLNF